MVSKKKTPPGLTFALAVSTYCTRTRVPCHLRVLSPTDRDGKENKPFDRLTELLVGAMPLAANPETVSELEGMNVENEDFIFDL